MRTIIIIVSLLIGLSFGPVVGAGVDSLSLASVLLHPFANSGRTWNATGFFVEDNNQLYLITNWHVVTNRNPDTDKLMSSEAPDSLHFTYHYLLGNKIHLDSVRIPLYNDQGKPRWNEHPLRKKVDVVALPMPALTNPNHRVVGIDLDVGPTDFRLCITQSVYIIGFPKGLTGGGNYPIWKGGNIASEPSVDYRGLPQMLVDARTISGMSGSPVVFRSDGTYSDATGSLNIQGNSVTKFIGVYSGRFPVDVQDKTTVSDIGLIWKPEAIRELLKSISDSSLIKD